MKHDEAQLAAARDLLADGASGQAAADALAEQFGVSQATAWRRVRAAREAMEPDDDDASTDYGALALAALADSIDAARVVNDWQAVAERAEKLANVCAKMRLRHAPRP